MSGKLTFKFFLPLKKQKHQIMNSIKFKSGVNNITLVLVNNQLNLLLEL
jgi:hypothetical protein